MSSSVPQWMQKHPCVHCGTGYGECAQFNLLNLQCCKNCQHPTRWEPSPYTLAELEEMWAPHGGIPKWMKLPD